MMDLRTIQHTALDMFSFPVCEYSTLPYGKDVDPLADWERHRQLASTLPGLTPMGPTIRKTCCVWHVNWKSPALIKLLECGHATTDASGFCAGR